MFQLYIFSPGVYIPRSVALGVTSATQRRVLPAQSPPMEAAKKLETQQFSINGKEFGGFTSLDDLQ